LFCPDNRTCHSHIAQKYQCTYYFNCQNGTWPCSTFCETREEKGWGFCKIWECFEPTPSPITMPTVIPTVTPTVTPPIPSSKSTDALIAIMSFLAIILVTLTIWKCYKRRRRIQIQARARQRRMQIANQFSIDEESGSSPSSSTPIIRRNRTYHEPGEIDKK